MINSIKKFFKSPESEINDNQLIITDEIKESAKTFLQTILSKTSFDSVVVINNDIDDVIYLTIEDFNDTSRIIGKEGQTLLAFQSLVQSFLAKNNQTFIPVFIDCNNYLSEKIEKVQLRAKELEKKLSSEKQSIELFPMTSFERRAIHTYYKNNSNIKTFSIGKGRDRRIVLELK